MAALVERDAAVVEGLLAKLRDPDTDLPAKYRILFSLRGIAGREAHAAMLEGLKDPSALFRHEVAYCLGQRQDPAAVATLRTILKDEREHPMVRHEAGEALGAIGTEECLQPLREHLQDPCQEVAHTCQLALQRIEHFAAAAAAAQAAAEADANATESRYYSVDPTPAAPASTPLPQLASSLLDEEEPIFQRYRAMFALRNRGGSEAVQALGSSFTSARSALLKHEVAYVLGQMQDALAFATLKRVLEDANENPMVRHEAAEALGSIAAPECITLLKQYAADPEPIVADSCVVALDMLEFEQSGGFQYADDGGAAALASDGAGKEVSASA
ncbi:deoxyhypusine hydroxylase [Micractinium conductrix]|uniref:Deoxyhypusine hydroxylase n=1 Tax=Micractinium conductrix TaxID=554055 RepID=A0A2P6VG78_9CHLO|nr:deoxyhypusine hydroxylase [Micractinium conductrix]|eukprot:PSC73096.1 deoxyhypusine hydroxylase [Micractinium conductrix]